MKLFKKESVQYVNDTLDNCWEFFSNPQNLQKLTPTDMGFVIADHDGKSMYPGQIIQYKVSPLFGVKLDWVSEITVVKDKSYFIDEQRFGPYAVWHHKHFFEATDKGVKMTDVVHYSLPLGFLGKLLNYLLVENKLKEIFEYREKRVNEIFNS